MTTSYRIIASPLGEVLLRAEGAYLTGAFFSGQKYYPQAAAQDLPMPSEAACVLEQAAQQLTEYFAGSRERFTVPLRLTGSAFRRAVWEVLETIPYGATMSYGQVTAALALPPGHVRAVGGAIGRNPVSVMVPCHRVLGASGDLTGYAGGMDRKRELLRLEGIATARTLPIMRQAALAFA